MANPKSLVPFVKGDPRINRKGKPKTFKQLRELFISISQEPVKDGAAITRIEAMVRDMLKSDNPSDRALSLKYGWGNVPDEIESKSDSKIELVVKYANSDNKPT
jgi:hypothetical protein